jgi:hypothetical protein
MAAIGGAEGSQHKPGKRPEGDECY